MEVPAVDPSILASRACGDIPPVSGNAWRPLLRLQSSRYAGTPFRNSAALFREKRSKYCRLLPEGRAILLRAVEELALSAAEPMTAF